MFVPIGLIPGSLKGKPVSYIIYRGGLFSGIEFRGAEFNSLKGKTVTNPLFSYFELGQTIIDQLDDTFFLFIKQDRLKG